MGNTQACAGQLVKKHKIHFNNLIVQYFQFPINYYLHVLITESPRTNKTRSCSVACILVQATENSALTLPV